MSTRQLLMAFALCVTAWLALFADKSPSSGMAEPTKRAASPDKISTNASITAPTHSTKSPAGKTKPAPEIPAMLPRETLIGGAHNSPAVKTLFGSQNWTPPPPPPPKPAPLPPPMAPPLPFTYMGKKFDGANWEVYMGRGDVTYIVQAKDVVTNTYHIDAIKPPIMTLTYLPLKQVQTLNIGGPD